MQVSGGTGTLGFINADGVPSPYFLVGDNFYDQSRRAVQIVHTEVFQLTSGWFSRAYISADTNCDGTVDSTFSTFFRSGPFSTKAQADFIKWTLLTGRTDAYKGACNPSTAICAKSID